MWYIRLMVWVMLVCLICIFFYGASGGGNEP